MIELFLSKVQRNFHRIELLKKLKNKEKIALL